MDHFYLLNILDYNPDTGLFIWKWRNDVRPNDAARLVGKVAGRVDKEGYVRIKINNRLYSGHRLAHFYMTGEWPEDEVDHENNRTGDNKWLNLRPATHAENCCNRKLNKNNLSGYKGVYRHKVNKKWIASIRKNAKTIYLGSYDLAEEASEAYRKAAKELFGEFAKYYGD